jgi:hypothetical protein
MKNIFTEIPPTACKNCRHTYLKSRFISKTVVYVISNNEMNSVLFFRISSRNCINMASGGGSYPRRGKRYLWKEETRMSLAIPIIERDSPKPNLSYNRER